MSKPYLSLAEMDEITVKNSPLHGWEPPWLRMERARFFRQFKGKGFPKAFHEEWRGSPICGLDIKNIPFHLPGLFVHNNNSMNLIGQDNLKGPPALFQPLKKVVGENMDLLKPYLFKAYDREETPSLAALNNACFTEGALLHMPKGAEGRSPYMAELRPQNHDSLFFPHNLVVLEEGSRGHFVEDFSGGGPAFSNSVTEVFVGPGAHLQILTLIHWNKTVNFNHRAVAHVSEGGSLCWMVGVVNKSKGRMDMEVFLNGQGAESRILGAGVGKNSGALDLRTVKNHQKDHTFSDIRFNNILLEDAQSIYRGMVRMAEGAVKSEAYQKNDNLLLGEAAKAQTIPKLEIMADDVKCSHGATVGRLDEEAVFYLTSRGVPREQARRILAEGFIRNLMWDGGADPYLSGKLFYALSNSVKAPRKKPKKTKYAQAEKLAQLYGASL